ncbi:MAG: peptide chain release factor N(5)-glutamine methyltransferase [Chitinophagales bacterium]|nr:peptide chain release factor N(5)-glutamine methyltransferase [Chitinophagales bacterium]
MHTYFSAQKELAIALLAVYDDREATAIAQEVMEYITGASRLQRITDKDKLLTTHQQSDYDRIVPLLLSATPLQYVLGRAFFMGHEFKVNEHVLIPRPETEELVQWILDDHKGGSPKILDIGTGSGCIPISLKLGLPKADVTSVDISIGAIGVAEENAKRLQADVTFILLDFLDKDEWAALPSYDVIVSNPPYIPETEQDSIHANVKDYEPEQALFVPGDDPQLFYRHIAEFGHTHLKEGGIVYCELHVDHAEQTQELFVKEGYKAVELMKDMHGNNRMLKAQK